MASIIGTIRRASDGNGQPVAGAPVAIQRATAAHPDIAARSGKDGRYRFDGLAPGAYTIGSGNAWADAQINDNTDEIECDILLNEDGLLEPVATPTEEREAGEGPEAGAEDGFGADPYDRDPEDVGDGTEESGSLSFIQKGLVYAALSLRLATGQRDRNKLTDVAYGVIHPEEQLPFSTSDPDFQQKSEEWLALRREIVDPLLQEDDGGGVSPPSASNVTPFGLEFQRMPDGDAYRVRRNAINWAIPEVVDAVRAIGRQWHRRHPGVTLWILDMSRQNGGRIYPPHKSHAVGCDVDVQLRIGNEKLCMRKSRYPEWRVLWQDLCDIARSNGVLPVKRIGFTDPKVTNVSHWPGHVCHVHIRFCAPPDKINAVTAAVKSLYADQPQRNRPDYRGSAAQFEVASTALPEPEIALRPTDYLEDEAPRAENAARGLSLVERGLAYATIGVAYVRGIREADPLTDEGWKAVLPEAPFPLRRDHDGFARKQRVWMEIREMVRGFLDSVSGGAVPVPGVAQTCVNKGSEELRRLAEAAEAAGAPEGFAIFAQAAAWTESRWNNCAINDSAAEAAAARRLFQGARGRGWFPETPFGVDDFGFGSAGWFGLMPSTGLIAGGNRGPFINAHPRLVMAPAASVVMLADFVIRVRKKYGSPDWMASRRAMASLALHGDTEEKEPRSKQTRLRFEEGLRRSGVDDPEAFMRQRPDPSRYPGAWDLWMALEARSRD